MASVEIRAPGSNWTEAAVLAGGKPVAKALLAEIPLANSGNNYVQFTPGPVTIDQFTGDVLHQFSANDQVQGTLGILAPMRMHYERVITAVAFMSQFFSENSEENKIS